MEREDDLVFGDTSGNQIIGNPVVKTIVVKPNFMMIDRNSSRGRRE
jgi:hypothetical protein